MCAVSYVGDYWQTTLPKKYYWEDIQPFVHQPYAPNPPAISKEDFDALKKDVEELKKLLKAAKAYDEAVGEPDCEMEDKVALIKKIAKIVGVDMSEIFNG